MKPISCLVLFASAYGMGAAILALFRARRDPLVSLALGLGMGATTAWTAGLVGMAYPAFGWALAVFGLVLAVVPHFRASAGWIRMPRLGGFGDELNGIVCMLLWTALAACSFYLLYLAVIPPTMHDTMVSQLLVPQQVLLIHKVVPVPTHIPTAWPFLANAGYLWSMMLGGDWLGPAVINWAVAVLCSLSVARMAGLLGASPAGKACGALAWFLVPMVAAESTMPLSDLLATLYAVLGMCAFGEWLDRKYPGLALLSGLMTGLAAACKYTAGVYMPFILVGVFIGGCGRGRKLNACILALVGVILALLPVMARNYLAHGSPLFPFFPEVRQGVKYAAYARGSLGDRTLVMAFAVPLKVIWAIPELFANDIWEAGGILVIMYMAPFLALIRHREKWRWLFMVILVSAAVGVWIAGFMGNWAFRWLMPVMAICAALWAYWGDRIRYGTLAVPAVLFLCILPDIRRENNMLRNAIVSRAIYDSNPSEKAYLRVAPRTSQLIGALEYISASVPADRSVACWKEPQVYYARHRMLPSLMHDCSLLEVLLEQSVGVGDLARRLRQANVTHLLYCVSVPPEMEAQYMMFLGDREKRLLADFVKHGTRSLYASGNGRYWVLGVGR